MLKNKWTPTPEERKEMIIKLAKWIEEYGLYEQIEKVCVLHENKKVINQIGFK